ncbi:Rnase l inhibitor-type atp binding cassette protein [Mycena sanguinolenta]|uniref:Rnase l inhibitor-type atp binding cassette protein n=1 Tax=Mycena sanguinolenta TaxID=230812 RepID=A0A8H6Z4L6_9AGAR|nr:Rnase l inhibitor-type atp binding cassette protein [Mycena sanguinolenta]
MADKITRIAIVDSNRWKPKRCAQECKKSCPVVKMGKLCIEVKPTDKIAFISEFLCISCGICVKKCPFEAIAIINLPTNLESEVTHRYTANAFKLHRLPTPRPGQVLGLVGTNGIGKSTALKILAGKLKPNLGRYDDPPDWQEILQYFRVNGSELQNYFTKVLEDNLKTLIKPQYIGLIQRAVTGNLTISEMLDSKLELDNKQKMCDDLELNGLLGRDITQISGGELQRFAIAMSCVQRADVYMFDEPSSYLDIKQRLRAAEVIRGLLTPDCYVIAVEHDLSVLDYLSDFICCLYGKPSMYGVVTMPYSVREGINIFLDGFIPTENLRFREELLSFKMFETAEELVVDKTRHYSYPSMTKTLGSFKLTVEGGSFTDSEIIVMLGENGMGKTTFIRLLAGNLPDDEEVKQNLSVSLKPQTITPQIPWDRPHALDQADQGCVHASSVPNGCSQTDEFGESHGPGSQNSVWRRTSACWYCLGTRQTQCICISIRRTQLLPRLRAAYHREQDLTRFILHAKKTAFVIEHDFIMATYLADRVIVFEGRPAVSAKATRPQTLLSGMNRFLASLEITFRRDPTNFRPRVNKMNSVKDREQKTAGNYFFLED